MEFENAGKVALADGNEKPAYLIIRENLDSPLVQSQVLDVLETISHENRAHVTLIWLYRIDYLIRRKEPLTETRKRLQQRGIELIALPFVSGRFPLAWWEIPFVVPQWVLAIIAVGAIKRIRLLHCRSYHAGLAAMSTAAFLPLRFIFDPRSPFPEENIQAYGWRKASRNFRIWKAIERRLCSAAACTFVVTEPFARSLRNQSPDGKFIVIPNNYPAAFDKHRRSSTSTAEVSGDLIEMAYVGSLGHWNDTDLYMRFLRKLDAAIRAPVHARFFVPPHSAEPLRSGLEGQRLQQIRISVKSVAQRDVLEEIETSTVGMYLMHSVDVRLGVKFVEYLAAGLPVIVSESIIGAADFVRRHNVGIVIKADFDNLESVVQFIDAVRRNRTQWKDKCRAVALREFSTTAVASRIQAAYASLFTTA